MDPRGEGSAPPFETKLFHFQREFSEKSGVINKNLTGKINKSNPFVNLHPYPEILDGALIRYL